MLDIVCIDARNPGPMTGAGNQTYLLVEPGGGALLVDAGVGEPDHLAAVGRHLGEHGARLDLVVVTHAHGDHIDGVSALWRTFPEARFAKRPWPARDRRYPVRWQPLSDGDTLAVGTEMLEVLHTPGHSIDHLAVWHAASRTAWTGDLIIEGGSVMIDWRGGGDLVAYLASLERIRALDAARLLPAHGSAIDNPSAVIDQHLAHRMLRERQIVAALSAGAPTVQAIAETVYDGLAPALQPAALENVRAHLEKLRTEAVAVERDGRWRLRRLPPSP